MEASISLALRNLQKSITCSICIDYFSNPITVLCGHSFCKGCIDQALLQKSLCPVCSAKIRKRTIEPNDSLQPLIATIANFVDSCQLGEVHSSSNEAARCIVNNSSKSQQSVSRLMQVNEVDIGIQKDNVEVLNVVSRSSHVTTESASVTTAALHKAGSLVNVVPRQWIGKNGQWCYQSYL